MSNILSAEEIRGIRQKYDLSQKNFAALLGIGVASIARYETGASPTKANANLIRAAKNPRFMLDCLNRDGDALPAQQRQHTEEIIYAEIAFGKEGGTMDINDIYTLTLEQEVLNGQAAQIMAEITHLLHEAKNAGNSVEAMVYESALHQLALIKPSITYPENFTSDKISELRGRILSLQSIAAVIHQKVA